MPKLDNKGTPGKSSTYRGTNELKAYGTECQVLIGNVPLLKSLLTNHLSITNIYTYHLQHMAH